MCIVDNLTIVETEVFRKLTDYSPSPHRSNIQTIITSINNNKETKSC